MNNTTIPGPNPRANRFDDLMRRVMLAKSGVNSPYLHDHFAVVISKDVFDGAMEDLEESAWITKPMISTNSAKPNVTEIQGLPVGILHGINDVVMVI